MGDPLSYRLVPVTITNGTALSASVGIGINSAVVGIIMPAAWTAANLTFQASVDDATFNNLYDAAGTEFTVTAAVSRFIALDPSKTDSISRLKVRSGTAGTPVNQVGADRTITLVVRDRA